jgi:hypothetical protein
MELLQLYVKSIPTFANARIGGCVLVPTFIHVRMYLVLQHERSIYILVFADHVP